MDIIYFEAWLQDSVEKAKSGANFRARGACHGLARLYREKLPMLRFDARTTGTSPRAGLSVDPRDG